jgi:hypothetical protein
MGVVTPYKSKNKKKVWTYCKYTLMRPFMTGWRRYGDEKAGHDPFGDFVGPRDGGTTFLRAVLSLKACDKTVTKLHHYDTLLDYKQKG